MESDFKRRAREYWVADGIPLLLAAVIYMFIVAVVRFLWFSMVSPSDFKGNWFVESFVGPLVGIALATLPLWLIAIAIWFMGNWEDIVEWFKIRLTYPRTGYVTPPSYWDGESGPESDDSSCDSCKSPYCRGLDFLGGFWFWALVQIWWRPWDLVLLIILLLIRTLRYLNYPDSRYTKPGAKQNFVAFLKAVLNSFWIWLWTTGLLSQATHKFSKVFQWGVWAVLTFAAIRLLRDVAFMKLLLVFICCGLCAVLLSKGTTGSTTLALFIPGLYAASVGTFRLVRHLRANPVPQT